MRKVKKSEIYFCVILLFITKCVCSVKPDGWCLHGCDCSSLQDMIDCRNGGYRAMPLYREKTTPHSKILNLANNSVTHLDLVTISQWTNLQVLNLSSNNVKYVEKHTEDFSPLESLKILDLSRNSLQVLHSAVFLGLPSLHTLNLSHNQIHTVAEGAFVLPSLVVLDISHNQITEAHHHLLGSSPHIEVINFSHNRLSRLLGKTFFIYTFIDFISKDLSKN